MKTAIRKYLLSRKILKMAKMLDHLDAEAALNKIHQEYVTREMTKLAVRLMDQDIRSRRELADA